MATHAFKYEGGVLMVYQTDSDNEYPGWRVAKDCFFHLNFPVYPLNAAPVAQQKPAAWGAFHESGRAVIYQDRATVESFDLDGTPVEPLFRGAVAQQPLVKSLHQHAAERGINMPTEYVDTEPAQQPQAEAPALTNAFLADVMTAAGLVSYGKQCKALGERLGAEVARLRTAAPQQAEAVPRTHVLVPKRMTRAMELVTEEEGWTWEDLLAAAESITEVEYSEIQMDDTAPRQAEAVPPENWYSPDSCGFCGIVGGHAKTCRRYAAQGAKT